MRSTPYKCMNNLPLIISFYLCPCDVKGRAAGAPVDLAPDDGADADKDGRATANEELDCAQ